MGRQRPQGFYRRWERQYHLFNKACETAAASHPFLLDFDLASFYDLVDHDLLLSTVRNNVSDVYLLELLGRMLKTWTGEVLQRSLTHGLPQGPEASGFLADMFLFTVDDQITNTSDCVYVRYVDDIRVFCRSARQCEVLALKLGEAVKRVGLVPNSTKTRVYDTRRTPGWLRQPDYRQFQDPQRRRRPIARVEHLKAKQTFLDLANKKPGTPHDELSVRRSLTLMLPDRTVVSRIIQIYPFRPDLWERLFPYLLECVRVPEVSRFVWRRLRLPPARDWESANLIEIANRIVDNKGLTARQRAILDSYVEQEDLPMAQAQSAATLLLSRSRRPAAKWLVKLSIKGTHLSVWLAAVLSRNVLQMSTRKSALATLRSVIKRANEKGSLLVAYLAGTRLNKADLARLPTLRSVYAQALFTSITQLGRPAASDEITPLLHDLVNIRAPSGFDFRSLFAHVHRRWYAQALRHLQLAAWYVDTSPTYFVNHIHNFNHVLWHFALRKHGIISPKMPWKYSMSYLNNSGARAKFPTMAAVFETCRVMRNTNLSSHPMDDKRSRFTKLVTYQERDRLKSQLRSAYTEFMTRV